METPDSPLSIFTAPSFTRAWLGTNSASASTKSFNNGRIGTNSLRLGRDGKERQGGYPSALKKKYPFTMTSNRNRWGDKWSELSTTLKVVRVIAYAILFYIVGSVLVGLFVPA